MSAPERTRFLRSAGAIALGTGAVVTVVVRLGGGDGLGWALAGWGAAAAIGVAGGAWLVARHGDPSGGFVVALLAGMLSRLLAFGIGAALAAPKGGGALWAFVGGFAASFVPLQLWEGLFFHRANRASSIARTTGGDDPPRAATGVTG